MPVPLKLEDWVETERWGHAPLEVDRGAGRPFLVVQAQLAEGVGGRPAARVGEHVTPQGVQAVARGGVEGGRGASSQQGERGERGEESCADHDRLQQGRAK